MMQDMFNLELFLGIPVDETIKKALSKINPQILDLYIKKEKSLYLQEVEKDGIVYLGKFAGKISKVPDLYLLEKNIVSILQNTLLKEKKTLSQCLCLIALPNSSSC